MGKKGYFIISSHQMPTEDSHWSDPTGGFHGKESLTPHPLACQLERAVRHKLWCLVESHLTASPLGRFQQSSKLHKSIRPALHWAGGGEREIDLSYATSVTWITYCSLTAVSPLRWVNCCRSPVNSACTSHRAGVQESTGERSGIDLSRLD